jgi:trk system potassium uptake protein TrkA
MKFCVIGLGRFGYQVATTLADNGMEVLAVDTSETLVNSIRDRVAQAICIDAASEDALRSIGIESMDVVIVAMGADFTQSILITALAKQHFGIPRVITRSIEAIHKEILMLVGADQVILPEQEIGTRLADMLSLPFNALLRLTPTFSLTYRKAPGPCVGRPISCLHDQYNVVCIGKKNKESIEPLSANYIIAAQDMLVYAGSNVDLEKLARY